MMSQVIEINSENIKSFANFFSADPSHFERIKHDFQSGYFSGLLSVSTTNTSTILGYLIYFKTYSTWQHRTYFVSNIWLNDDESGTSENKFNELKRLFDRLVSITQDNQINRINLNLSINNDKQIIEWLLEESIGKISLKEAVKEIHDRSLLVYTQYTKVSY